MSRTAAPPVPLQHAQLLYRRHYLDGWVEVKRVTFGSGRAWRACWRGPLWILKLVTRKFPHVANPIPPRARRPISFYPASLPHVLC